MGVDVVRYKAAAFTVSSMYAGLGGVLTALAFGRIVPESFGFLLSVDFLVMIVIGGAGSVGGAAAGAVFVTALPLVLNHYSGSLPLLAEPGSGGCRRRRVQPLRLRRRDRRRAAVRARRARRARPPRRRPRAQGEARMSRRLFGIVVALALRRRRLRQGRDDDAARRGEGAVKTGPGATADTITLGYLPDLSGVFAPNGKSMMEGAKLYWDAKNEAGGICGRQIEVDVQDTGYDPQKAVAAYQQMSGDVDRPRARARLLDHLGAPAVGRAGGDVPELRRLDVGHPAQRERRDRRHDVRHRGDQRGRLPDDASTASRTATRSATSTSRATTARTP